MSQLDSFGGGAEERAAATLDRLHPEAISDPGTIGQLLDEIRRERTVLWRGMNRRIDPETARVNEILDDGVVLRVYNFDSTSRTTVFLNFAIRQQPYFFSAPLLGNLGSDRIKIARPEVVYRAERRTRVRRKPSHGEVRRVLLEGATSQVVKAEIADTSPEGMCVCVADSDLPVFDELGRFVRVRAIDGRSENVELHGEVRNRSPWPERSGWTRVGLDVSSEPRSKGLSIERRTRVLPTSRAGRVRRRWRITSAGLRLATERALESLGRRLPPPDIRVVDYKSDQGEPIRGIIDSWGETKGATAVVIPPAWGRTKETLLPLAATIVASFRAANAPVVVLRFDGIRKRGESHNDPECRMRGKEHHRFTFSQGVRDISSTIDFLKKEKEFGPQRVILVSFSAASIESRRATADDERIDGWVCVVGAADTQAMIRVISGGLDYVGGIDRGLSFGLQEILGVEVDIDYAGSDVLKHSLAYLSDSRRDFSRITAPVTWIHGTHDAWMDRERACDVLSRGVTHNRRFVEVPTGHVLKSSAEALETFQFVAAEVSRMAMGSSFTPVLPDLRDLARRQLAERRRLPSAKIDLHRFWEDYLVGRDGTLGIELMTHTSAYEELMAAQVNALDLKPGDRVGDIGSGTGAFPVFMNRHSCRPDGVEVFEVDYVRPALQRARMRLQDEAITRTCFVEANLDLAKGLSIPIASESLDCILGSLFLSYVRDPLELLKEIGRILKPRGRLVLSCLRPDADISRLFTKGIEEVRSRAIELSAGLGKRADIETAARGYLNQAARLLDLEDSGRFQFWDRDELSALADRGGFKVVRSELVLGEPPQAILISATKA